MNRFKTIVATLGIVATAIPAVATAAPYQSVNTRQAQLERRIDQGIRSGALTRGEAAGLRNDFRGIARLENQYRRSNGLSAGERRDLDRRFDALSARVRYDKHDRQDDRNHGRGHDRQHRR